MRWYSGEPSNNDVVTGRVVQQRKYAWWPTRCWDSRTYWLCRIRVVKKAFLRYGNTPTWKTISIMPEKSEDLPKMRIVEKVDE